MRNFQHLLAGLFLLGIPSIGHTQSQSLSLERAQQLALGTDPGIVRHGHLASAQRSDAIAAGQLPDPVFRVGAMNFPVDTFDRDQEPMTQVQFGVRQMFPPGDTLSYRQQEKERIAEGHDWDRNARELIVRRDTTVAYVSRLHAERRLEILQEELREYDKLHQLVNTRLHTGSAQQADLLAVQLERANRKSLIAGEKLRVVATTGVLARWVGTMAASAPLSEPDLDWQADSDIHSLLSGHPALRAAEKKITAAESRLAQAKEAYAPTWGVDLAYGRRNGFNPNGERRADFATAMISVSVPLFPEKRQDAALAARQAEVMAAREMRSEMLLQLREEAARAQAQLEGQEKQLQEYREQILPAARLQLNSALRAYRSVIGSFESLLRARLAVQRARMAQLDLEIGRYRTIANLQYLSGQSLQEDGHE